MKILNGFFAMAALSAAGAATAQESVRLTDVIKSGGSGSVDFFKDLTAAQLEQLRADNGGFIVVGVDVNESANGTEKASAQAVALGALTLTVGYDDGSQAVLQPARMAQRSGDSSGGRRLRFVGLAGGYRGVSSTTGSQK